MCSTYERIGDVDGSRRCKFQKKKPPRPSTPSLAAQALTHARTRLVSQRFGGAFVAMRARAAKRAAKREMSGRQAPKPAECSKKQTRPSTPSLAAQASTHALPRLVRRYLVSLLAMRARAAKRAAKNGISGRRVIAKPAINSGFSDGAAFQTSSLAARGKPISRTRS
jgi:hypothetical protein